MEFASFEGIYDGEHNTRSLVRTSKIFVAPKQFFLETSILTVALDGVKIHGSLSTDITAACNVVSFEKTEWGACYYFSPRGASRQIAGIPDTKYI